MTSLGHLGASVVPRSLHYHLLPVCCDVPRCWYDVRMAAVECFRCGDSGGKL